MDSSTAIATSTTIHRLPNDVLEEIFTAFIRLCAADQFMSPGPPMISEILQLIHICKRWREVATCYPSLWSWFDISIVYPAASYTSPLRFVLQNAGPHPLSFSVYQLRRTQTRDLTNSILGLLLEKHNLWKDVRFTLTDYPHAFTGIPEGYFPNLESVQLYVDPAWTSEQRTHLWRILHSSPAIHTVMLDEFCKSISYFDITPWNQLHFLDIVDIPIAANVLLDLLGLCEVLERLNFTGDLQPFRPVFVLSPIVLSRLQQMHISFKDSSSTESSDPFVGQQMFEWFMGSISAPSLTRLGIWLRRSSPSGPFIDFTRRSGCYLQQIKLWHGFEPKDDEAAEWLKLSRKTTSAPLSEVT